MAEVIYALESFVATQEGQLTVEKNEQLYLLNDDHYYWWYVQHYDSPDMGFVPAELVEFPNERLARQNSLRNQKVAPGSPSDRSTDELRPGLARQRSVRFQDSKTSDAAPKPHSPPPSVSFTEESPPDLTDESMDSSDSFENIDINEPTEEQLLPDAMESIHKLQQIQQKLQLLINSQMTN